MNSTEHFRHSGTQQNCQGFLIVIFQVVKGPDHGYCIRSCFFLPCSLAVLQKGDKVTINRLTAMLACGLALTVIRWHDHTVAHFGSSRIQDRPLFWGACVTWSGYSIELLHPLLSLLPCMCLSGSMAFSLSQKMVFWAHCSTRMRWIIHFSDCWCTIFNMWICIWKATAPH